MTTITITTDLFKMLVENAREADMLKKIIRERSKRYGSLNYDELRMLKEMFLEEAKGND